MALQKIFGLAPSQFQLVPVQAVQISPVAQQQPQVIVVNAQPPQAKSSENNDSDGAGGKNWGAILGSVAFVLGLLGLSGHRMLKNDQLSRSVLTEVLKEKFGAVGMTESHLYNLVHGEETYNTQSMIDSAPKRYNFSSEEAFKKALADHFRNCTDSNGFLRRIGAKRVDPAKPETTKTAQSNPASPE